MKKFIFICLIPLFVILFHSVEYSLAQESTGTIPENTKTDDGSNNLVLVAEVNIYEAKIDFQDENKFKISFELSNKGQIQPDVRYAIQLVQESKIIKNKVVDEQVYPESINLNKDQKIKKEIEYIAPEYLKGKYELWVIAKNQNGLSFGMANLGTIVLAGSGQYVEILQENCYLSIEGSEKKYTLSQGVDLKKNESIKATCIFKNHYNTYLEMIPEWTTYHRSGFGQKVDTKNAIQKTIKVAANEVSQFSLIIPIATKAQAYNAELVFKNKEGINLSNKVVFRYVLRGKSATIQNLRLDKNFYQAGENAQIFFNWSGPADSFFGSRYGVTDPGALYVSLMIWDDNSDSCTDETIQELDKTSITADYKLPITRDCINPVVTVKIQDSDKNTLDRKEYKLTSSVTRNTALAESGTKINEILPYISASICFLMFLLFIVTYFLRKKKLVLMIFMLIGFSIFLYSGKVVSAETFAGGYWVAGYLFDINGDISWEYGVHPIEITYALTKETFAPGEEIGAGMMVTNFMCINTLTDYTMMITINDTFEQDYYLDNPIHEYYDNAPATPGAYNVSFGYRDNRCYPEYGSCSYAEDLYLVNKAGQMNTIAFEGRTDWHSLSAEEYLKNNYGSVLNHFNLHGKVGCSNPSPVCEDIPGCEAACAPESVAPWFSVSLPYNVVGAAVGHNGECGSRNTNYLETDNSWPALSNYCNEGIVDPVSGPAFPSLGATVNWDCKSTDGGEDAHCSASKIVTPINGECGFRSANYAYVVEDWPVLTTYCQEGTIAVGPGPTFPTPGTNVAWVCNGSGGGASVPCGASRDLEIVDVDAVCGTKNTNFEASLSEWPNFSSYCDEGTEDSSPLFPDAGASVNWVCEGLGTGDDVNCSASRDPIVIAIDGECGNKQGVYPKSINSWPGPSEYCLVGTPSEEPVFPALDTSVNWICQSIGGGVDATCTATHKSIDLINWQETR